MLGAGCKVTTVEALSQWDDWLPVLYLGDPPGAAMALQSHPFPDPTEAIVCPAHKKIKLVKYENFKAWM